MCNPFIRTSLRWGHSPSSGHYGWPQLHKNMCNSTPEIEIPPLIIRTLIPRVSRIEIFHCTYLFDTLSMWLIKAWLKVLHVLLNLHLWKHLDSRQYQLCTMAFLSALVMLVPPLTHTHSECMSFDHLMPKLIQLVLRGDWSSTLHAVTRSANARSNQTVRKKNMSHHIPVMLS